MKYTTWMAMAVVAMFAVAASAENAPGQGEKRGNRFKTADADSDGKLSATEFATLCTKGDAAARFATADADKDGFLTKEEMKAAHHGKAGRDGKCNKGAGCEKKPEST